MPEHAFRHAARGRTAEQLAATFNVPLEQLRQRRAELGLEYLLRSQPRA